MTKRFLWKEAPFIRLVIPLILGVILENYFHFSSFSLLLSLVCFISSGFILSKLELKVFYKLISIWGILLFFVITSIGALLTFNKDARNHLSFFGNLCDTGTSLIIKINEPIQEKSKTYKGSCTVENIINGNRIINATGKIFVYFEKSKNSSQLKYGDRVLIKGAPQEINNAGNPGEFDYKTYASRQQIYYTIYAANNTWHIVGANRNAIMHFIYNSRETILSLIKNNIKGNNNQASLAEALLIGYTADLDKELLQEYINTGVVHIIAISGMHLGLIYLLLIWVLNRIPGVNKLATIKAILILICIWLFALLTGGNASILRSALMFSCILVAQNTGKQPSIYNGLCFSAFLLLCYNPFLLWDVGFQLSYLSILGIVIFHKYVVSVLNFKNKLLAGIWNMMSLTICAQLLTFPLCIYYFHQFPNIFLLSNLILIPLSSLILFVEIILLCTSPINIAAKIIGEICSHLISVMNNLISWFNSLPHAVTENLRASVGSTLLLYVFIFSISVWILRKSNKSLYGTICSLSVLVFLVIASKWKHVNQNALVIYNIKNLTAIDFIRGKKCAFIGDEEAINDNNVYNYDLKPSRIFYQASDLVQLEKVGYKNDQIYFFHNKSLVVIDNRNLGRYIKPQDVDIVLLTKTARISIQELQSIYRARVYVFDHSNQLWKIEQWKKECEELHLRFHSIPDKGAFILNL